jgi:hypothetical protein
LFVGVEGRRKKEEGRRKKEEGRRKKSTPPCPPQGGKFRKKKEGGRKEELTNLNKLAITS